MRLTRAIVEAAVYRGDGRRQCIQWDDEIPGFGLRINPGGRRSFIVRYRTREGKRRYLTLGPVGLLTVTEARERARAILSRVCLGEDPAAAPTRGISVADLCRAFIEDYARHHRKTWREDQSQIERWIIPALGAREAQTITPADLGAVHTRIGRRYPRAANKVLGLVGRIWNLGQEWQLIPEGANPARRVKRYRERSRDRWLTPDEMARLLEAIEAETTELPAIEGSVCSRITVEVSRLGAASVEMVAASVDHPRDRTAILLADLHGRGWIRRLARGVYGPPLEPPEPRIYLRAAFWLLLLTGWRKTEVLALRWADIDLDQRTARIRIKGGRDLVVPLSAAAVGVLERLPRAEGSPWVLPGRGGRGHLANIDKAWRRIRARAGIPDVRIHDLRRSVGSWIVQAGHSLLVAQKALGHRSYAATLIYARLAEDQARAALDQYGARLLRLIGEDPDLRSG